MDVMDHYPKILDSLDDDGARFVLDELQRVADAGVMPGFEGDPRAGVIVDLWREKRLGDRLPMKAHFVTLFTLLSKRSELWSGSGGWSE